MGIGGNGVGKWWEMARNGGVMVGNGGNGGCGGMVTCARGEGGGNPEPLSKKALPPFILAGPASWAGPCGTMPSARF